ncbi:MAG: EAL domain-containing protein [Synechococcus sp. ELA057]
MLGGTLSAALGLSYVLQAQMSRHLTDKILDSQTQRIREKVDRFDTTLRHAEASVVRYASLLSSDRDPVVASAERFDQVFRRDPDGSWRVPRQHFDPRQDANAWIPPDVPLNEANKRFYLQALEITRDFGQGALRDPLVNSWMLPLINGMTAYWPSKPDYLYNAASNLDYRKTPWVTLTDPAVNPRGEPRWVGPEYDPAAKDWSISVVAPFTHAGRWAGAVGHDMVVSRLLGNLFDVTDGKGSALSQPLFVANAKGSLLALPGRVPRPGDRIPSHYFSLLAGSSRQGALRVIPDGTNYLVVAAIPTLKANLFYSVDGSWLRRSVQKELLGLQVGQGLFVLLAVGAVGGLALRDLQSRRQQQLLLEERNRDLSEQARRDPLTNLPNRLGLIERASESIDRANRNGSDLLVIFLDLDRFKFVNDSMGHDCGDALLQAVADRLRSLLRSTDTISRLGGDEFVLIIEDLDDQFDAAHIAEKLLRAFEEPLMSGGQSIFVTPSIGISIFPEDGREIDTLMRQADLAMYAVKARGRNGWKFFAEEMNQEVQERLQLERDIRRALERGEFCLYYQPQWLIDRSCITGWEALLRWQHPERGLLLPELFIPVAEDNGMIRELGIFVLRQACLEAVSWQQQGLGRFSVSVNLSVRQFEQDDLLQLMDEVLTETSLDPSLLELEITESLMLQNPDLTLKTLNLLRLQGIRVAIDDFGTGYSSLSYLSNLPIDRLKIDRTFVLSSLETSNSSVIIEAVISLAGSLGMSTIAEGVETDAQRRFLRLQGCEQIQGFLMGRPMPSSEIAAYLGTCV